MRVRYCVISFGVNGINLMRLEGRTLAYLSTIFSLPLFVLRWLILGKGRNQLLSEMGRKVLNNAWDESSTKVVEVANAGRSVVATQNLTANQCLLTETPQIFVPQSYEETVVGEKIESHPVLASHLCDSVSLFHGSDAPKSIRQLYANSFVHPGPAFLPEQSSPIEYVAVYQHVSMMNHSCAPNAVLLTTFENEPHHKSTVTIKRTENVGNEKVITSEEQEVAQTGMKLHGSTDETEPPEETIEKIRLGCFSKVVTLRPILKGEEISISYQTHLLPTSNRRKIFKERYGFVCQCKRCSKNETDPEEEEATLLKELPSELVVSSCARRVKVMQRHPSYQHDVLNQLPLCAIQTQTFKVLLSNVIIVEKKEVLGVVTSYAVKFPVWPSSHFEVCRLREILLQAITAAIQKEQQGEMKFPDIAGIPRAVWCILAQQQLDAWRLFFSPYLSDGIGDESDEMLCKQLRMLLPQYEVYEAIAKQ